VEDTARIVAIWAHILGIALFVGPQFFMAIAWGPAARSIGDQRVRLDLTKKITSRFGILAGAGLGLIVIAGMYLISSWRDYYSQPDDLEFTAIRYGVLFIVKMTVLIVMLAVVGAHIFFVGPRLVHTMEDRLAGAATDADVRSARMLSMAVSIAGLVLALAMMVLGVMMSTTNFSFDPT
jgi:uncharacterized membrane protein